MGRSLSPAVLAGIALLLPLLAAGAGLAGGTLRLEPAAPAAAFQAGGDSLQLHGLLGQPATSRSSADGLVVVGGFHTPAVAGGGAIFSDGFEERP